MPTPPTNKQEIVLLELYIPNQIVTGKSKVLLSPSTQVSLILLHLVLIKNEPGQLKPDVLFRLSGPARHCYCVTLLMVSPMLGTAQDGDLGTW